ncbi:uncharacterized protein LOC144902179 [Branchiostoma floridae x Branchiostoma belcheri]
MAASTPLTEQDIDSLTDIMAAVTMLSQYGVPMEGVTNLDQAKARLRGKLLEDSGGRFRKPGDAAIMMKNVLQHDKKIRRELLQLCDSAIDLLVTTLEPDVPDNLNIVFGDVNNILIRCRNQLVKDDCPILVAGETSSGKSTLLNVLLGENILPSSVLSTTSVICEIKYGTKKKAVVHLRNPDPITNQKILELPLNGPTEVDLEKISQYVHMKGEERETASNLNCDKVEIYWPLPLLEGGIFIVDSPGVGESDEMDKHVSNYISNAFAFIYVISSPNAGGVQEGRLPKLLELCSRAGPQDLQLVDPKAAIFVCNKWDQIPMHEREEVKQDTLRKLRQHWPLLDDSQLFCFSAQKAQEAGFVTDDLDKLLDGIDALLPQGLRHKVKLQYSWILTLIKEATKVVRAKLTNATRTQEERRKKAHEVEKRLEKNEEFAHKNIRMLEEGIKKKEGDAVQHLREYLQSDETKAAIASNTLKEAPSLSSIAECNAVREKIGKLLLLHIEMAMRRWDSSHQYVQKIEYGLIKDFKDTFNLIEEKHHQEIEQALNDDLNTVSLALQRSVEDGDEDSGVLEKVILGVTAPIWVPLAIASAGLALALGVVALAIGVVVSLIQLPFTPLRLLDELRAKMAADEAFMKAYNEDKKGCIGGFTDQVVQEVCKSKETGETDLLEDFVKGCLQRTKEHLEKLKNVIPKIQEADRQMIEALGNESRSQEELLSLYRPQIQRCNALLRKLALFNLRRIRKIEYNLDELLALALHKIDSGGFGRVYKVQIKRQGSLNDAALKIVKKPITEENVMEFHNEEECLRYLKDPHIVDFYGLAAAPQSESGGLRLGVLMEYCPYTLLSWLHDHKERTPAWWPDDEAKMETGFNTVRDLALQLCLGLKAMHEKRYMHRDLKLENVLVTEEGVVKIADMGLAKPLVEVTRTPAGTVLYAAPEVFRGREHYDISADIYSLGFCLLEMWYGLCVTEDKEYLEKVANGTHWSVTPPTKLPIPNTLPPCSGWVDLMKACWKDPKSRPTADVCEQILSKMKP